MTYLFNAKFWLGTIDSGFFHARYLGVETFMFKFMFKCKFKYTLARGSRAGGYTSTQNAPVGTRNVWPISVAAMRSGVALRAARKRAMGSDIGSALSWNVW